MRLSVRLHTVHDIIVELGARLVLVTSRVAARHRSGLLQDKMRR